LAPDTVSGMVTASTVLLQAPNREVVKAVLGFLKVAIVVLPPEQLGPHVPEIVRLATAAESIPRGRRRSSPTARAAWRRPHARDQVENLLTWPEEHRKRFRDRSKHIFMRLIRKFGCVPRGACRLVRRSMRTADPAAARCAWPACLGWGVASLELVSDLVPEEHRRLITKIRKEMVRSKRLKVPSPLGWHPRSHFQ